MAKFVLSLALVVLMTTPSFKEQQLKFDRVIGAYADKEQTVKELLRRQNVETGFQIFIRAFKKEREVEVWAKGKSSTQYSLLTTYAFCTTSGVLGPKRKEGDLQIPEGVYRINHFNPFSTFHLSLGINYPNASDRILADRNPGGAIYIHGNCVSIGCIPITDDKIKELYILAVEAKNGGQESIPVHIFPARLNAGVVDQLKSETGVDEKITAFWANLQAVYSDFESTRKLKPIRVNSKGAYEID